jgi:hypothetical protein
MQSNSKSIKLFLASILAIILIVVYAFHSNDANQFVPSSRTPNDPTQAIEKDPFKEFLERPQQGAIFQVNPSPQIEIITGNSKTIISAGTDPFKAFLDAQNTAKPAEAAISPFSLKK